MEINIPEISFDISEIQLIIFCVCVYIMMGILLSSLILRDGMKKFYEVYGKEKEFTLYWIDVRVFPSITYDYVFYCTASFLFWPVLLIYCLVYYFIFYPIFSIIYFLASFKVKD